MPRTLVKPSPRSSPDAVPDNRLLEPIAQVLDQAPSPWRNVVDAWRASEAGRELQRFLSGRQAEGAVIFPRAVLRALDLTPPEAVRVVILGQDPYHGRGQAEGLAFSVPPGVKPPPSLRNLLKELQRDLGLPTPANGHLGPWARQGVLLLNACLTVEEGRPGSHSRHGWEALTDGIVTAVAEDPRPKAFLLWGAHAQAKADRIAAGHPAHRVWASNHPSPLSAGRPPVPFHGCGHFGDVNRFLAAAGRGLIDWRLA